MPTRRIAFVTNRFPAPSETFLRTLLGHFEAGGHVTQVIAHGHACDDAPARETGALGGAECALLGSPLRCLAPRAAHTLAARGGRAPWPWLRPRSPRRSLVEWQFGAGRFDVVYFSFSGIALAYEPYWEALSGLATVVSCRGSVEQRAIADRAHRARLVRLLNRATLVHCVSEQMRDQLVTWGAPAERLVVIRPAVDTEVYTPPEDAATQQRFRLLSVGRLTQAKGHDVTVRAVAMLRERGIDATLSIIGDGELRSQLAEQIVRFGLAEVTILHGAVPPEVVRSELAACDVFVLASRWEGISNAMLEAMASGRPVVATSIPGTREAIAGSSAAQLFPVDDGDALAAALQQLHDAPELRRGLGEAGRALAVARFSLHRQRSEWLRVIERVRQTGNS